MSMSRPSRGWWPKVRPRHWRRPPRSTRATSSRRVVSALEVPLIGRAAEMERLASLLKDALDGHGRLVTLIGEAGIGKTRVVAELATSAEQGGGRVLLGRSYESEQALPFGPW